ncbi:MAG TPA: 4'-phosphopantetheinyl transferase superfamily protein [Verrucomicrobiae bacterium]|nr:4'-phosphopantetheinyl transferase superfamily protein [Verrucomicrobiae bacterium]
MNLSPAVAVASRPVEAFAGLLPPGVASEHLRGPGDPLLLLPAEWKALGKVTPERARQFAAGRVCARRAAAKLGVTELPIAVREDRRPHWPESLVGSITHTDGFCAAAVGLRQRFVAIGIDAERLGAVTPDIWGKVLSPEEERTVKAVRPAFRDSLATLIFSTKEAFYKCQYQVTGQWLEFRDVAVDFLGRNVGVESCSIRPLRSVQLFEKGGRPAIVRFTITRGIVLSAMTITAH